MSKCRQVVSTAYRDIGFGPWSFCVRSRVSLPAWEQRKLGELFISGGSGGTPAAANPNYYDGEIPFLGIADIEGRDIVLTAKTITKKGLDNSAAWIVPSGSVCLAMYASVGKVAISRIDLATSQAFYNMIFGNEGTRDFIFTRLEKADGDGEWEPLISTGTQANLNADKVKNFQISVPSLPEQARIGALLSSLDSLITLHQREPRQTKRRHAVLADARPSDLFHQYYRDWITVYKEGAVRNVTLDKYLLTHEWLKRLAPNLQLKDLNRIAYQTILNGYAEKHERQTTMDFHHQMKGAILDAVDDGLIDRDPTRKAIIKGKTPRPKKQKYLNQFELHRLLSVLDLGESISWDWMILLIAKTGLRFSEALAITPEDFDFTKQIVSINKTWDYKNENAFAPTKNPSSNRKVQLDWQLVIQFATLVRELPPQDPIFVRGPVYNATINDALERRCLKAGVPVITVHGLRHTHASLLLFAGVSIASVAKRLGHASMNTTEKTYLHVIRELENKDVDLVMRSISGLI